MSEAAAKLLQAVLALPKAEQFALADAINENLIEEDELERV
jgi:hypothetical protein